MDLFRVLAISACIANLHLVKSQDSCVNNDEACPEAFGYFPDCATCSKYIQCEHGTTLSRDCSPGLLWNDIMKTCVFPHQTTCIVEKKSPCGTTPDVTNGKYELDSDDERLASLQCDENFLPRIAEFQLVCSEANSWVGHEDNLCISKTDLVCAELPPHIDNGRFQPTEDYSSAHLICDEGFQAVSSIAIECIGGTWEGFADNLCNPKCIDGPVEQIKCPSEFGFLHFCDTCTAFIECANGIAYSKQCPAGLQFDIDKKYCDWSTTTCPDKPTCEPVPSLANGKFKVNPNNPETANLQCADGFLPAANYETINCELSVWTEVLEDPCIQEETSCDPPPTFENGQYNVDQNNPETANLQCADGYLPAMSSNEQINCESGVWTEVPEYPCIQEETSCEPPPTFENGQYIVDLNNPETANLQCADGFLPAMPGNEQINCESGVWTEVPEDPCIPEETACEPPPTFENGQYIVDPNKPETGNLQCSDGFLPAMPSNEQINCESGVWTEVPEDPCIPELDASAKGMKFMVVFFENLKSDSLDPTLEVYMASFEETNVTTDYWYWYYEGTRRLWANLITTYTVNDMLKVSFPQQLLLVDKDKDTTSPKSFVIESDSPINVYAYSARPGSSDASIVFPIQSLGTEYVVITGPENPSIAIISTDISNIRIDFPDGKSVIFQARFSGAVYYIQKGQENGQRVDLSGTIMTSTVPFAVFSGSKCAQIPVYTHACDTLYHQVPPVISLRYAYVVSYLKPRGGFRVQVLAVEDNTRIELKNGTHDFTETRNRGETLVRDFGNFDTVYITANKRIMVAQYALGNGFDRIRSQPLGDPSLIIVPALTQFENRYIFKSLGSFEYQGVYIVIKTTDKSGLRLDGEEITGQHEIPIEAGDHGSYTVSYIDILLDKAHRLTHTEGKPFGAIQYGAKNNTEYGFSLGFKLIDNAT